MSERQIHNMSDTEGAIQIRPQSVTCGFLAVPFAYREYITSDFLDECVGRCHPDLWTAVRRLAPKFPTHMITPVGRELRPNDVIPGLSEMVQDIDTQTIILNIHEGSFDGGQTMTKLYSGFCFPDQNPRLILPRNGGLIPG